MRDAPTLPCSRCGSTHTELRNSPPNGGLLQELTERILKASPLSGHALPGGKKFVVCKDCGHVACICIR